MNTARLQSRIRGELLLEPADRDRYSRAECIYRIPPAAVLVPAVRADVCEALAWTRSEGMPVTARGAGSAVAGQSVGTGLIIDFSRHFHRILEIRPEEQWARVEPGVVLEDLNRAVEPVGLRFAPDPASAAFCTLGGMIATNAGGARSVRYGATRDHLLAVTAALSDGEVIETRPLRRRDLSRTSGDRQTRLGWNLAGLIDPRRREIEAVTPSVPRRSSGYDLLRAVGPEAVDLAQLLAGSEGTLALTVEAKIRLVPIPAVVVTALAHFKSLEAMGEAIPVALLHRPSALEALDRSFLDLVREAGTGEAGELPAATEAVLIVEVEEDSAPEAAAGLDRLERDLVSGGLAAGMLRGLDPESRRRIWEVRKAASPILSARAGRLRSTRFIEDAGVPTPRFPVFLREVRRLLARHRLSAAVFGHAGDGILHVNPLLDPTEPEIGGRMERIAAEYNEMVLSLGGSLSGEHGDGRLRTPQLARAFGEPVAALFEQVKELFDPENRLNPGIKVHDGRSRMSDHLDLGPRPVRAEVPAE